MSNIALILLCSIGTDITVEADSLSSSESSSLRSSATSRLIYRVRRTDILLLLGALTMLCWPWVLFVVIFTRNGIPLNTHVTNLVQENYQTTNFVITQIATVVKYVIGFFFSTAVLRFAQQWMAHKPSITNFHLSLISAFMDKELPSGIIKHRRYMFARKRWIRVVLAAICLLAFSNIPSGVTSLISPIQFDRTAGLIGNELDFAIEDPTCLEWFNRNMIKDSCQWKVSNKYNILSEYMSTHHHQTFKGLNYSTCQEDIMLDVLQSGRASVSWS